MRIAILGAGLMGGKLGTIFRASWSCSGIQLRAEQRQTQKAGAGRQRRCLRRHAWRGREGRGRAVAGRALVANRRCAKAGRRFVRQSDRHLLPADGFGQHETGRWDDHVGSDELAKKAPKARVVCAFNTVPSEVLFGVFEARSKKTSAEPGVTAAMTRAPKDVVAKLIDDAGFDAVDVGPLRIARYTQPFALLVGEIAYNGQGGPETAYRFERFNESAVR
jgi:8-hydroxy-5-deazaflavin:NADPH oxidoreductase